MKHRLIAILLSFFALSSSRADDAAKFHPLPVGERVVGRYVVALSDSTATEDPSAVASLLLRTYGGRLEVFAQEGFRGFLIAMTPAKARLLSSDPRVAWVEEQAAVDAVVAPPAQDVIAPPAAPSRPMAPRTEWATAPTLWDSGTYSYDGSGNITAIGTDTYRYDATGRVKSATAKTVKNPGIERTFVQTFDYDSYGNMKKVATTETGKPPFTAGAAVNVETNQLTGVCPENVDACFTAVYDGAGNQTGQLPNDGQYHWDALGEMTEANVPGRHEEYIYDANGERVVTIILGQGETRRYTLRGNDNKVARELVRDSSGNWSWAKDYVYRSGTLLAAYVAGESGAGPHRHYHLDHLSSTRLVTDSVGYKLATHTYFPFGAEVPGSEADGERMKFAGHERDSNPFAPGYDLDYMHARYYGPMVGRFLSIDPVMDVNRSTRQPQSWNRYSYVINNPINRIDPDGRMDGNGMGEPAEWSCPGCTRAEQLEQSNQIAKGTAIGAVAVGVVVAVAYCGPTCWKSAAVGAWNWARRNPNAIQQTMNLAEGLASPPSGAISIGAGQLQAKFKHAGDFGVTGNFNKANAAAFGEAIQNHVQGSGTVAINGAYRSAKNLVTYHLDQATSRVVITDRSGNFISAYKATARQVEDIVKKGWGF